MLLNRNLLCCLIFFLAGIYFSIYFYSRPVHDFGNYYYGSRFASEGKNIREIYEPFKFNLAVRDLPGMQQEKFLLNYAVVPPFTLFFYMPLTVFDVNLSKFLFNLLSLLIFCFYLYRLINLLDIKSTWILLLPVLVFIPFRNNLLFGQAYLLITGLIMAGFIAETKNKNYSAAICYSLAIVLKISPAILLIYLLLKKKYRLLFLTSILSIILFILPALITGWDLILDYLLRSVPRMSQNEINNPFATTYQSAAVLLRNIFVRDELLNPNASFNSSFAYSILNGIITGFLFFLLIANIKKTTDNFSAFAITLFGSLLMTAYTSSYGLVFLIPLCILLISNKSKNFLSCLVLLAAIANLPVGVFQSMPLLFRFPRLYLLIGLFFMLAVKKEIIVSQFNWLLASVVFFTGLSFSLLKKSADSSTYFLPSEAGLLSYDFQISENNLLLKTLYEGGSRVHEYVLADSVHSLKPLTLVDGQIFYNGSLTNSNDNKLNPVLVNDDEVVYLSDKNRGIGFYALRKLVVKKKGD